MKIKLSNEKLRYLALFEEITGVTPKDCVEGDVSNRLTFIIDGKDMGKAIGQNGRNIQKVRNEFEKRVEVVEYSDDPKDFLENIFSPVDVYGVDLREGEEGTIAVVEVDEENKGRAVGRNGWNIKRARKLLSRHHGLAGVKLA